MKVKGVLLSVASVLVMSLSPLTNMFSLSSIDPMVASFYSSLFSALFCLLFLGVRKKSLTFVNDKRIYLLGVTNSIGVVCQYFSLFMLGPIAFGLIGRFYIIFSLALAVFILREKIKSTSYFPIVICILGSFLVVNTGSSNNNMMGIMLGLLYTFLFALTNLLAKKLVNRIDSSIILFYNQIISTLLIGAFIWMTRGDYKVFFAGESLLFIVIAAFCSGFLGIILFYESIKYIKFSVANLIRSLNPVIVFVYSYPFFPIEITAKFIAGSVMIVVSVIWLNLKQE
ncbi:DMT family transporter [Paenibacillus tyrfis]|uniref:DMT family transporter n=1 Tax=Paenibacillus tyrfis TaxID=1501230 RepID=UPI0015C587ED|nr:DMT family transporter [Paenibacillus tyrfis]